MLKSGFTMHDLWKGSFILMHISWYLLDFLEFKFPAINVFIVFKKIWIYDRFIHYVSKLKTQVSTTWKYDNCIIRKIVKFDILYLVPWDVELYNFNCICITVISKQVFFIFWLSKSFLVQNFLKILSDIFSIL